MRRRSFLLGVAGALILPRPTFGDDQPVPEGEIGLLLQPPGTGGARVEAVYPGFAAQKAGLQSGDIVTKLGDVSLAMKNRWQTLSALHQPVGTKGNIEWRRDDVSYSVPITWDELPASLLASAWTKVSQSHHIDGGLEKTDEFGNGSTGILAEPVGLQIPVGTEVVLPNRTQTLAGLTKGRVTSQLSPYRLQMAWAITPSGTGAPSQWDWFEVVLP